MLKLGARKQSSGKSVVSAKQAALSTGNGMRAHVGVSAKSRQKATEKDNSKVKKAMLKQSSSNDEIASPDFGGTKTSTIRKRKGSESP